MSLDAGLKKAVVSQFFAVKLELPGATVRFFQGRGEVTVLGETYSGAGIPGEDGVWGSLEAIGGETDQDAPRVRLVMSGLQATTLAETLPHVVQGSPVTILDVVLDPDTLEPLADPEPAFYGFVDTCDIEIGAHTSITVDCASAWEWLFMDDETARRNDTFHQMVAPGERGFRYTLDATKRLPWGAEADARPVYGQ